MDITQTATALTNLKTREELVADALREAILRGTFKPGEKLDQQDLADRFGVSRSPIREALRTIAAEDLITLMPHKGAVVKVRTPAELEEFLFIRMLLEGIATRRGAEAMTATPLAEIEAVLIQGETSSDVETVLELNNTFHNLIYTAHPQPILIDQIQQLRNKVAPYNRVYLDIEGRKQRAWEGHRRIYEACVARDGERAEAEAKQHLQQVFEEIQLAD